MIKKITLLLAVAISLVVFSGCVIKPEITTNSSILTNQTVPQNAFKTVMIYEQYSLGSFEDIDVVIIAGNLTDIRVPNENDVTYKDILIFEDGTIVSTTGVRDFNWERNKVQLIEIVNDKVKKVVISK